MPCALRAGIPGTASSQRAGDRAAAARRQLLQAGMLPGLSVQARP